MRRLILLEASKVKNQHSTLMDGILRAYNWGGFVQNVGVPTVYAHQSLVENLSDEARSVASFRDIKVMDPQRRRLLRKSILEFVVVLSALWKLDAKKEYLLVTTLLPSAGIFVEIAKWLFPHKKMAVMIHGEIEGVLDSSRQKLGSYGLYMRIWFKIRAFHSKLDIAVIDDFIAETALRIFPRAVNANNIFVIPMVVETSDYNGKPAGVPKCCFIGFRTPIKGHGHFVHLCAKVPDVAFFTIGGGVQKDERTGKETPLPSHAEFVSAISACDIAVFPYLGGYTCSLSAAATDAIAAGTHLLTTDRPCFGALAREFGPATVTICNNFEEMLQFLQDNKRLEVLRNARPQRLSMIPDSRYGLASVSKNIGDMLEGHARNQTTLSERGGA